MCALCGDVAVGNSQNVVTDSLVVLFCYNGIVFNNRQPTRGEFGVFGNSCGARLHHTCATEKL